MIHVSEWSHICSDLTFVDVIFNYCTVNCSWRRAVVVPNGIRQMKKLLLGEYYTILDGVD